MYSLYKGNRWTRKQSSSVSFLILIEQKNRKAKHKIESIVLSGFLGVYKCFVELKSWKNWRWNQHYYFKRSWIKFHYTSIWFSSIRLLFLRMFVFHGGEGVLGGTSEWKWGRIMNLPASNHMCIQWNWGLWTGLPHWTRKLLFSKHSLWFQMYFPIQIIP